MVKSRREILKSSGGMTLMALLAAAGWLKPGSAAAQAWNKSAFDAKSMDEAMKAFGGGVPVIDARRGEVFTAGPALARPEELEVAGKRLVGDGAVRYRELFEAAGAEVPPDDDPAHLPSPARLAAHAGAFGPADGLEPLYGRQPDAKPSA